jgi:hypothetical protein
MKLDYIEIQNHNKNKREMKNTIRNMNKAYVKFVRAYKWHEPSYLVFKLIRHK